RGKMRLRLRDLMTEMALAASLQRPLEQAQQRVVDDADMFVVVLKLEEQPEVYLVGQTDKAQEEQW
ncbi:hypothetical protein L195_g049127, partial [Trifolium pratense]